MNLEAVVEAAARASFTAKMGDDSAWAVMSSSLKDGLRREVRPVVAAVANLLWSVRPTREEAGRALYTQRTGSAIFPEPWESLPEMWREDWREAGDAMIALLPGSAEEQVKAAGLREAQISADALLEAANDRDLWGPHGEDDEMPMQRWLRARAAAILAAARLDFSADVG